MRADEIGKPHAISRASMKSIATEPSLGVNDYRRRILARDGTGLLAAHSIGDN